MHCIVIDNGSLANILYHDALVEIGISLDQLGKIDFLSVGFTGDTIQIEGAITLPVKIGQYPCRSIM